ncbi:MAG: hypothetical protein WKG07_40080 [Hymenobacter sp.]
MLLEQPLSSGTGLRLFKYLLVRTSTLALNTPSAFSSSNRLMRCLIPVERDLLWSFIVPDGFHEETLSCRFVSFFAEQEIDCLTLLIDCTIQVGPLAFDTDVRFINTPR